MSMDFGYDIVTADEYERQRLLYGPLTESLHRLIAAALHTDVDEDTVREAQASIDAVTEVLEREQRTATAAIHEATGPEGAKTYARGYLSDADGATVEAEGVFIVPAWARDAG